MKIKERALSLLLSMVLVLTFMPALAFAEGDEPADAEGTPTIEALNSEETLIEEPINENPNTEEPAEEDEINPDKAFYPAASEKNESSAKTADSDEDATAELILVDNRELVYDGDLNFPKEGDKVVVSFSDNTTRTYTYTSDGEYYDFYSDDDEYALRWNVNTPAVGDSSIRFNVWDYEGTFDIYFDYGVTVEVIAVSISFSPSVINLWGPSITVTNSEGTFYDIYKRYHWTYPDGGADDYIFASGDTLTVAYSNGEVKTYRCEATDAEGYYDAWFVCGEERVWPDLWLDSDSYPVPGNNAATIVFKGCSAPVTIFIDTPELQAQRAAAAAEAARQGTPGSLPGVKASKPKASKKAITVKWKKLKKKQLKSGVSNIEVWVCSDGAFANGSTIERVVGKKKSSLKIKGLQKGVTYYVKVRAITYSGGTKIVGPWSAVKKVKVKK